MQRVEGFNNRIIEHLSAPSPTSTNGPSSSSTSSTNGPSSSSVVSSSSGSSGPTMIALCQGSNYLTGDSNPSCGCNRENTTVRYQTGDGNVLVDMCSDGSAPVSNTGTYCANGKTKLVYEISNNTISYRSNALSQNNPSVPAITRRWCA